MSIVLISREEYNKNPRRWKERKSKQINDRVEIRFIEDFVKEEVEKEATAIAQTVKATGEVASKSQVDEVQSLAAQAAHQTSQLVYKREERYAVSSNGSSVGSMSALQKYEPKGITILPSSNQVLFFSMADGASYHDYIIDVRYQSFPYASNGNIHRKKYMILDPFTITVIDRLLLGGSAFVNSLDNANPLTAMLKAQSFRDQFNYALSLAGRTTSLFGIVFYEEVEYLGKIREYVFGPSPGNLYSTFPFQDGVVSEINVMTLDIAITNINMPISTYSESDSYGDSYGEYYDGDAIGLSNL